MQVQSAALAALVAWLGISLQGCGGGGGGTTTTTTTTGPTPAPTPAPPATPAPTPAPIPPGSAPGWKSHSIVACGPNLCDSVTGDEFVARGIGFPNEHDLGSDVSEWVKVLQKIRQISPEINLVRLYDVPECIFTSDCFEAFMKEADDLGIYVLAPGSGTKWGWWPGAGACKTAEDCYKMGGVQGFGQSVIQKMNYPNTLAIVIANEFDQFNSQYMAAVKAYARDLKWYMNMCNSATDSPSVQKMRQIPLLYASSDDKGDKADKDKADFMFCQAANVSVDIFGLNIERYCDDKNGKREYDSVNQWVFEAKYPGAFIFSEMGCFKNVGGRKSRTWNQVPNLFAKWPSVSGYIAYTYYGNPNFDMLDKPTSDAQLEEDGENFVKQLQADAKDKPNRTRVTPVTPTCKANSLLGHDLEMVEDVERYDTGKASWSTNCPAPPKPKTSGIELQI